MRTSQPIDGGVWTRPLRDALQASPREFHRNGTGPLRQLRQRTGLLILRRPCLLNSFGRSPQLEISAAVSARRLLSRNRGYVIPWNPLRKMMGQVIVEMQIE